MVVFPGVLLIRSGRTDQPASGKLLSKMASDFQVRLPWADRYPGY
jgi:hypothetical protein